MGLDFIVRIRNVQDSEYTGKLYMYQMVKYLRTKQFVRIKQNFGIYKIRNRQIILHKLQYWYFKDPKKAIFSVNVKVKVINLSFIVSPAACEA